ncbi:MAG: DUF6259 domain-containing protein [Bryobacteraceae bacterium]
MTRSTFLRSVIGSRLAAWFQGGSGLTVSNQNHRMEFDARTGGLKSFRAANLPDQEFLPAGKSFPAFVIQYIDQKREFQQLSSADARDVSVAAKDGGLEATYRQIGGLALEATVTVKTVAGDAASYWLIRITNNAGLAIADVQFPFVVVRYGLGGKAGSDKLLVPFWMGRLLQSPQPQDLTPDSPRAWQFRPETQATWHYPGMTTAQLLAYYNERAGMLLMTRDHEGRVKQIKPVAHDPGLRLGVSHVGDWPANGTRELEYPVTLQAFEGDWYEAAEIYRTWSLGQPWARTPLHSRKDVPAWLMESPPHIMIRVQGELDHGPSAPVESFLPYPKLVPLLEKIAARVDSPLVPVLMAWEKGGPWVYPDCFPPVGGDASVTEFATLARQRQWRTGSYSNGTRWVTAQFWSGYRGEEYLRSHHGEQSICRTAEGDLWQERWDLTWRESYTGCLAAAQTRELAKSYVERLTGWGLDWIQFLDQNVGCSTFPCYGAAHGHAPMPGRWMTEVMQKHLAEMEEVARNAERKSANGRTIMFSVECPPNEFFMPYFSLCDSRVSPPGHKSSLAEYVPLYHYLYHEFLLMQGGFGFGPEPYHLVTQSAYNFVLGQICGGVLTGDGLLMNRDSINWAPWRPAVGNNDDSLAMIRAATALRRGAAKQYLAFGRMQKPPAVSGIRTVEWKAADRENAIAAVFHAAWKSPEGKFGVALANWTGEPQPVTITDSRLDSRARAHVATETVSSSDVKRGTRFVLPAHSCAMVEGV